MIQIYYSSRNVRALGTLVFVIMVVILSACSDMNDIQQVFLDRGEMVYAAKVDSIAAHPGRNRLRFDFTINSQRIKTVRVFWNDYKDSNSGRTKYNDSSDVTIEKKGVATLMLENLEERSYRFRIVSFDEFGHASLPTEVNTYIYGPKYQAQLISRSMRSSIIGKNDELNITWGIADGAYASEVRYTNTVDNIVIKSFPIRQSLSIVQDLKPGTGYEYRTVYRPDTTGIDPFYTDFVQVNAPFAHAAGMWELKDFSSQYPNRDDTKATNFIDGTDATRWHTDGGKSYPHWIIIDMGKVRSISKFGAWATTFGGPLDTRAPSKIKFYVSMDNSAWTDLGEYNFDNNHAGEQIYIMPPSTQGRYIKFEGTAPGSDGGFMVMGEISAYY